jgi:O-antigen ligase/tetratricopeptide (TPR) repeat protein
MQDTQRDAARRDRNRALGFHDRPAGDLLLGAVDLGLFAAIFVLPMVMGGRQAIGEFILTAIACFTMLMWLLRQTVRGDSHWRLTAMTPLLLIGIGIGVLQMTRLSPEMIEQLTPHQAKVLPAWSAEKAASIFEGPWATISLVPYETQRSLICVIACALLFVVAVNRMRGLDDVRRMIRALALSMTLMALFGSLQYLFGNGLFFGVYEHPFTNTRDYAKGAFTNPNHFADYVAMAMPLLLAWYATSSRNEGSRSRPQSGLESLLIAACMGCVALAVLLSQSRGGLLAACIGTIVCLFFLHRVRALDGRTAGLLGSVACVALLSLLLLGDRITALVEANFHELASADLAQLDRGDSRQKIWQAALAGIRDYPLLGTGLSSHREVYWTYFDHPDNGMEFSHAENGYLQLALETGLVGMAVAGCCLLVWLGWCLLGLKRSKSVERGALLAAILGVITINLAHSVTDFVWYAPSIMVVIVLLAACAAVLARQFHPAPDDPASVSGTWLRPVWGIATAGCLLLSGWMLQTKLPAVAAEPHWFDYIKLVQFEPRLTDEDDLAAHTRDKYTLLLQAARVDPHDARIQARVARVYQSIFDLKQQQAENPMSLLQLQDAALASEWTSTDELSEWLNRPGVLGENRKYLDAAWDRARHAITLCPLQSDAYLVFSELAWIYGGDTDQESQLLAQALTVRPYDPEVHFVTGRVASLRGNEPAALEHWKESFHRSGRFRRQITALLAPVWPAQHFLAAFAPDTEALATVVDAYRTSPDVEGFQTIAARLADELSRQAEGLRFADAVKAWRNAHNLYVELGDAAGADRTARAAVAADPNNLQARRALGKWLFSQQQYTDAIQHLEWCKRRNPGDSEIANWLQAAIARQPAAPEHSAQAVTPASYSTGGQ